MKRRDFVKNLSLAAVTAPIAIDGLEYKAIHKKLFTVPKAFEDRVLVLVRLNGGNDGLNTIIPLEFYDNLAIQRNNILLPETSLLSIGGNNAMHPAMTGMHDMYHNGKLSIIQNVGYPDQNRSHFRSMDIWTSGKTAVQETTGWLGRYFSIDHENYPNGYPNNDFPDPFAISMGFEVSATCQGLITNFSHSVVNPFDAINLPNANVVNDGSYYGIHMEYLSGIINQTNAFGAQIKAAAENGNSLSQLYDTNNHLAMQLRHVAKMISGGLTTKVYILNINGFDTHDNQVVQGQTTIGEHTNLLKKLSDAIHAFQDDLGLLGLEKRVVGMTFSEFGRQIASNGSIGTDHGDAAPMFIFGDCLNMAIYGDNPEISDVVVPQAGIPMQFDFRDIYASVLRDWFGVDELEIDELFENAISYHPIFGGCNLETAEQKVVQSKQPILFPNPVLSDATLRITMDKSSMTSLLLIDVNGRIINELYRGIIQQGQQDIPLSMNNLSAGSYYLQVLTHHQKFAIPFVKSN